MTATISATALRSFYRANDLHSIRIALQKQHPADIVQQLEGFEPEEIARILLSLPESKQPALFGYFDHDIQMRLAHVLDRRDLARIFAGMSHDERADLFADLSEEQKAALLPGLAQAEREDMRRLASYPEGTVGAVMTSDYVTLEPKMTAGQAIDHLRAVAPDAETIYHSYVIDPERHVLGTVALRDLIVARPGDTVEQLMRPNPAVIRADAPQEEVVNLIRRYDVLALPVIDSEGRLVGIVTYDDAMDVAEEEVDQDFHRVGGLGHVFPSVRDASIKLLYQKRVFWLVILVFGNIFSGAGIAFFEETIEAYVALVFFLPLLIDSGGNAGSQSATLMVRALATGDVRIGDWGKMLGREIAVAGLLGLTMALAVSAIGLWRGGPEIAAVVSSTMVLIVIVGSVIGMSIPFVLSRLKFDPAAASAPLITSIADATGVVIYFAIATAFLPFPDEAETAAIGLAAAFG
jgi:magnesium transporter